jgi:hypothetical protein
MEVVVKLFPSDFKTKATSVQSVQILWCADGWSYIPELRVRRRFFVHNTLMKLEQQPWEGTIPVPEHWEEVELHWYSTTLWRELSEDLDELISVTTTSSNTSK